MSKECGIEHKKWKGAGPGDTRMLNCFRSDLYERVKRWRCYGDLKDIEDIKEHKGHKGIVLHITNGREKEERVKK